MSSRTYDQAFGEDLSQNAPSSSSSNVGLLRGPDDPMDPVDLPYSYREPYRRRYKRVRFVRQRYTRKRPAYKKRAFQKPSYYKGRKIPIERSAGYLTPSKLSFLAKKYNW